MLRSSIHSVVLLALQRKYVHCNYFNVDPNRLNKYLNVFPVFARSQSFMMHVRERFDKFKLDEKEYALYATILIISAANKYLKNFENIAEIRHQLGEALRKYMNGRTILILLLFNLQIFIFIIKKKYFNS